MTLRLIAFIAILYALGLAAYGVSLGDPAPTDSGKTDAIVVLTGGAGRIEQAVQLVKDERAERMLIAGADPSVRKEDLIKLYPGSRQTFDCCVELGSESVDTLTNGEEAQRWIARHDVQSIRLVTSDWHMRRALFEFRRVLGEDYEILPDAVRTDPSLMLIFKEYNKYLLRRLGILAGIRA